MITITRTDPEQATWSADQCWLAASYCEAVAEELQCSWIQEHRVVDPRRADEIAQMLTSLLRHRDHACMLLARDGDARIGYFLGLVKECLAETPANVGYVNGIYVIPAYRKHGVARSLVTQGMEWFRGRGLKLVELYTATGNHPAKALWEAFGFRVCEEVLVAPL